MTEHLAKPGQTVAGTGWTPRLRATLDADFARVDELWRRVDVALTTPPASNSVSALDHADEFAACAHDLAAAFLRSIIDHLITWKKVSSSFQPTYAHFSLIRTAHESAWLAYWLMEPGIDPVLRLARGIAAQHDDLDERRKIELAMGSPMYMPPAKSAADRLVELMDEAEARGLTKLDKKSKRILATPLLSAVELFDKYEPADKGQGSYLYRLYSGYAHGKQWALSQGAKATGPATASGTRLASVGTDPLRAVAATQRAVNAMEKAVNAFIDLRS